MNDPIKNFRLSNIVAMASNDSRTRSANGREVELLVRLVLLLLFLDFFAFPQMLNTSWGNARSDWIERLVGFLAEGQGILWFSLQNLLCKWLCKWVQFEVQIAPICTTETYREYI